MRKPVSLMMVSISENDAIRTMLRLESSACIGDQDNFPRDAQHGPGQDYGLVLRFAPLTPKSGHRTPAPLKEAAIVSKKTVEHNAQRPIIDAESTRSVPPTMNVCTSRASSSSAAMLTPLVMTCSPCLFLSWRAISSVVVPESRTAGGFCAGWMSAAAAAADAPLLFSVRLQTLIDRRLPQDLFREHGSAVGTQHQPALMQFVQVVADGDCRTLKRLASSLTRGMTLAAHNLQDLGPALLSHHPVERAGWRGVLHAYAGSGYLWRARCGAPLAHG